MMGKAEEDSILQISAFQFATWNSAEQLFF